MTVLSTHLDSSRLRSMATARWPPLKTSHPALAGLLDYALTGVYLSLPRRRVAFSAGHSQKSRQLSIRNHFDPEIAPKRRGKPRKDGVNYATYALLSAEHTLSFQSKVFRTACATSTSLSTALATGGRPYGGYRTF